MLHDITALSEFFAHFFPFMVQVSRSKRPTYKKACCLMCNTNFWTSVLLDCGVSLTHESLLFPMFFTVPIFFVGLLKAFWATHNGSYSEIHHSLFFSFSFCSKKRINWPQFRDGKREEKRGSTHFPILTYQFSLSLLLNWESEPGPNFEFRRGQLDFRLFDIPLLIYMRLGFERTNHMF